MQSRWRANPRWVVAGLLAAMLWTPGSGRAPAGQRRNPAPEAPCEAPGYLIITTESLLPVVLSSSFQDWKEQLGYQVRILTTSDPLIGGQAGRDPAEKIRNFLRRYQPAWNVRYLLMVGDYLDVPMRFCHPDPDNHWPAGAVPTDAYYADLTLADADSWDWDGDGYYGEYGEDLPDFEAEVSVGRIPTSGPARVRHTLDKTVRFEQDTGEWKNRALHMGAFWYFTDENGNGRGACDAARCLARIEAELMPGWQVSRYTEQQGLEKSAYEGAPLDGDAVVSDWRRQAYGVVNWGSHGWPDHASRKIWSWDDGDGVPESGEFASVPFLSTTSALDADHPSIVFAMGCNIGSPEPDPNGNLGIDLLTKPAYGAAVAIVSSTRSPATPWDWPQAGRETRLTGGIESLCYEFNRYMILLSERVGDALVHAKQRCHEHYAWDSFPGHTNLFCEYLNLYCTNLYGDPALVREGVAVAGLRSR